MHARFTRAPGIGSLNGAGVAVVQDKGDLDEMDTDQIVQILMRLQEDGARRDERQLAMGAKLDKLLEFKEVRTKAVDDAMSELKRRDSEFERRLEKLENSGLSAWSAKRVAQWMALITLAGALFGAAVKGVTWAIAHYR